MLPQMDPTWFASQSFWLLITFCAMLVVVRLFIMPAMRATVDLRQARLDENIKAAEKLKAEAEALITAYDARIEQTRREAQAVIDRAQAEAAELIAVSEKAFTDRLNARIADGERKIERIKAESSESVRSIAAEITGLMAGKLGPFVLSAQDVSNGIDRVTKEEKP